MLDISLIASSVRPHLWEECFDSLQGNKCRFEVVFVGDCPQEKWMPYRFKYPFLRYIQTERIKPAQCYEIARRAAFGEYIMWIADDCEFSPRLLDKVTCEMIDKPYKTLLSLKTNENGQCNDLDDHRFFDGFQDPDHTSPLMAPLGVINARYLEELGGFDRRYLCGQYENDVAMRVYADGGQVDKYEDVCVFIDHIRKHGESNKFWSGYDHDRKILEDTWAIGGYVPVIPEYRDPYRLKGTLDMLPDRLEADEQALKEIKYIVKHSCIMSNKPRRVRPKFDRKVSMTPLMPFEPYERALSYESEGPKGQWL